MRGVLCEPALVIQSNREALNQLRHGQFPGVVCTQQVHRFAVLRKFCLRLSGDRRRCGFWLGLLLRLHDRDLYRCHA